MTARHVVGIDLGTTHTAMAIAPIAGEGSAEVQVFAIPQLVARASLEGRELLPSFLYFAHESEGAQALPWDRDRSFVVGEYARSRGLDAPARLISQRQELAVATRGVDRRAGNPSAGRAARRREDLAGRGLVALSRSTCRGVGRHVRRGKPELALAEQEVVLTVPASFDAAARELTVEAAHAAGLEHVTLLEEPQAALYAWLAGRATTWRKRVQVGDVMLVVDVGGGTTDFSLIAVSREGRGARARRASPSATTSCSAATTWISRSPTPFAKSSRRPAKSSTAGR